MLWYQSDHNKILHIPWQLSCCDQAGLDTYYFLNLAVGQPSNNMDLSEIEIYLGMMIIFFPFQ